MVVAECLPAARGIAVASVVGLALQLGLYTSGWTINTGLTASLAVLVALPIPLAYRGSLPAIV